MKLYQGKYRVSNPSKYKGDLDNIIYRSMWEAKCFAWCDKNPKIKSWSSEETVVPYYYDIDKKYHKYFIDLRINFKDGKTVLVEIKPKKETQPPKIPAGNKTRRYVNEGMTYVKNMNKWKAANEMAKDRGWEFQIWTEDTLHEMGILPKWKKMKKLKPLKRI
tara:strand:- start:20183 stop:20668 length:486 start_codon:yes stop_codon:yes gene_type:complete